MKLTKILNSGVLIAIVGIVLFSAKAVMVKLAYQYHVNTVHLLLFRMLFSLPFFLTIALINKPLQKDEITKKDYIWIVFFGFVGYYLASYLDFVGLQFIKAGLERIILFIYPTFVILLSKIFLKKEVTKVQLFAIAITYFGLIITFWNEIHSYGDRTIIGILLILFSALTYASYLVGSGWLIPKFGVKVFTSYAMLVSTFCVSIHYLITDRTNIFIYPYQVYLLGFLMAFFSTVIPSFLVSLAIQKMGASKFSIIGSLGPISTILLAYLFLGERLTFWQVIGSIIIIMGVSFIALHKKSTT